LGELEALVLGRREVHPQRAAAGGVEHRVEGEAEALADLPRGEPDLEAALVVYPALLVRQQDRLLRHRQPPGRVVVVVAGTGSRTRAPGRMGPRGRSGGSPRGAPLPGRSLGSEAVDAADLR